MREDAVHRDQGRRVFEGERAARTERGWSVTWAAARQGERDRDPRRRDDQETGGDHEPCPPAASLARVVRDESSFRRPGGSEPPRIALAENLRRRNTFALRLSKIGREILGHLVG